jgi:hypothetical protein
MRLKGQQTARVVQPTLKPQRKVALLKIASAMWVIIWTEILSQAWVAKLAPRESIKAL